MLVPPIVRLPEIPPETEYIEADAFKLSVAVMVDVLADLFCVADQVMRWYICSLDVNVPVERGIYPDNAIK